MKNLIIAAFLLFSISVNAQEFNGVPIDGDLTTFVAKMKAKGYSLRKYIDNGVIMEGKVGYQQVEVFVFTTPKSKKVFRLSVYFPKKTTWYSLKSSYNDLLSALTEKYGEPETSYSSFSDPYFEGDGYEMSAVSLEKVNYYSAWLNKLNGNLSISLEISKYNQVNVMYDNEINVKLRDKELNKIQNSIL